MIQSNTNLGVSVKVFCRCGLFQSPLGDYHGLLGLSTSTLELCYFRFGPWANNINITWMLVRHADWQASPRPTASKSALPAPQGIQRHRGK